MPNFGLFRASSLNPAQELSSLQKGNVIPFCTFSHYNPENPNPVEKDTPDNVRIYMRLAPDRQSCQYSMFNNSENNKDWCSTFEQLKEQLETHYKHEITMINSSKITPKQGMINIHEAALGYYAVLSDETQSREINLGNIPKKMSETGCFVGDFGLKALTNRQPAAQQKDLSDRLVAKARETLVEFSKVQPDKEATSELKSKL